MASQITRYRSDRGEVFDIAKMETSHLVNVIGHHLSQIETLQTLGMTDRVLMLRKVISVLREELNSRDVNVKEYLP